MRSHSILCASLVARRRLQYLIAICVHFLAGVRFGAAAQEAQHVLCPGNGNANIPCSLYLPGSAKSNKIGIGSSGKLNAVPPTSVQCKQMS